MINFAESDDPSKKLKNLRLKNVSGLISAQFNFTSLRNKFDSTVDIVNNNIDVLQTSETKLDSSFPTGQFSYS